MGSRLIGGGQFDLPEQRDTLADQVQAAAKVIGIYLNNTNPDFSTYLKDLGSGNYDLADFSWQRSSPDALRTLFGSENVPKGGFGTNLSNLDDPAVDQDFVDALATTDLKKQGEAYGDA